jgi:hypothetical protein
MVPPARKTSQTYPDRPGQLAKCGCRTRGNCLGSIPWGKRLAFRPKHPQS